MVPDMKEIIFKGKKVEKEYTLGVKKRFILIVDY